ncbi:MAG: PSD1 domain-containing protein [Planctomyces sp.]|nr:PSD1 domain-containing protein [Planctomyces sp.]
MHTCPRLRVTTRFLIRSSTFASIFSLVTTLSLVTGTTTGFAEERLDFNRDVRPILSDACFACHGPDSKTREAGLRLDISETAVVPLSSGTTAIVPGSPDASEVMRRIVSADPDHVMPPPSTGKKLTDQQVATLKTWIEQGAEWKGHWSFLKPEHTSLPEVSDPQWVVNPIDAYVLKRLELSGLQHSERADKVTLIRRVTLDLTGLPPTPAEVDAFLADDRPEAFATVVDRLLASPRFGEHMARYWLDLVRYGDSHGLHLDNERALWKYREWVIQAINQNKPFDQFTVEQIAGDLLPNSTVDQKVATGFNRCNVSTSEGGSINEEVLVRYAVDRTETMSTVFLGMTLGCAVCHDHKFDPVSQKEFYQLFAFYNAAADAAMDGNALAPPPTIRVPSQEQTARLADLDQQIAETQGKISEALARIEYIDPGIPEGTTSGIAMDYVWIDDEAPAGAQLQGDSAWEFVSAPEHQVHTGLKSTRREADGLSQHFFTGANPTLKIGESDRLFAWCWLDPANPPKSIMLQFNDGTWEHRAFWGEDVIPFASGTGVDHKPMGPLPQTGQWVRLEVSAADVGLASGAELNGWAFTQFGGNVYWDTAGVFTKTPQSSQSFESQLAWEQFDKSIEKSTVPQPVRDAIKVELDQRNEDQKKQIREYFIRNVHPNLKNEFAPLQAKVDQLTKEKTDVDNAIPVTMIMADLPTPRETFILRRGEYNMPGEKVEPGVPAILPPLPADAPRNRLGLARWLVDPSHPLTARVTVNRYWQQFFGTGIVKTAEDFGSQGQWPTHPELLDWLALSFIESGWDVKGLCRTIVLSNTYQQSSLVKPEHLQSDPANELLARGPRFRLDAEVVRDSALNISGLLVESIGGKSVKPYQPSGLWEAVAFVGSTTQNYSRDNGDALYRRSMYTFWKRTSPPPSLMAFDAPSRETCVARRARTNTPLQALVLMNDEQYVEASRKLAERILREQTGSATEQLTLGFRLCTGRSPSSTELSILEKILADHLEHYRQQPEAAGKLLAIGASPKAEGLDTVQHAAMTMIANLLLNLDETITKE